MIKSILTVLGCLYLSICHAQIDTAYLHHPPISIQKLKGNITLDGQLNDPSWQSIDTFNYIQFDPTWGIFDSTTFMKVAYDDRYLYVGAQCFGFDSTTNPLVMRNLVRDQWLGDDWFTFHIDAAYDKTTSYCFSIYPLGSRYDFFLSNDNIPLGGSSFDLAYDMIWDAKTNLTDNGWELEMKIPLSNLRFRRSEDGKIYAAISSARSLLSNNSYYTFPALDRNVAGSITKPSIKQPIVFEDLQPKKQLLVTPYLLAGRERQQDDSNEKNASFERQVGLDVRYSLTNSLILDLTVNTDFAQVEVDDQQVNLTRFSLFFPEQRRFFLEQAGLFDLNLGGNSQLFYSRRIGINNGELNPILGGARITGKIGSTEIGALSMQTAKTNNTLSENFSVLRFRQKVINNRSFVGGLFTNRWNEDQNSSALGLDGFVALKNEHYLQVSLASTFDNQTDEIQLLQQSRLFLQFEKRLRAGWNYSLRYNYSGTNFQPEVGFLDRSSFHSTFFSLNYGKFFNGDHPHLRYFKITPVASEQYWNVESGQLETWLGYSSFSTELNSGDNLELTLIGQYESLQDTLSFNDYLFAAPNDYYLPRIFLSYSPAPQWKIPLSTSFSIGKFYGGNIVSFNLNPRFNINKHLNIDFNWQANRISLPNLNPDWLHIMRLKTRLALDLHFSASLGIQYNSSSEDLISTARLRYNFRDGHDLYFVYNEDFRTQSLLETQARSNWQTLLLKYLYTF